MTVTPTQTQTKDSRLIAIDALRGVIMIVMALDHANAFIAQAHPAPEFWSGPYPQYPDALSFLTRFVTHLAAPGFFFLMGVGMLLFAVSRRRQGWSEGRIARHFLIRGAILIVLQLIIENRAWFIGGSRTDVFYPTIYIGVLYALGGAMIIGALLVRFGPRILLAISLVGIVGTELLLSNSGVNVAGPIETVLQLLLVPSFANSLVVLYPVLPWVGVMSLGMVFGHWLLQDRAKAYRGAFVLGLLSLVLFFIIRNADGFGNIRSALGTDWIAFLNVVKYPPSIVFLLVTLGVNLVLLALFSRVSSRFERWLFPVVVLGRSPLFFYITHLYLYGVMGLAFLPRGTGIPRMYPYWLLGLLILIPLTWLYGRFKHSRAANSIWRFA